MQFVNFLFELYSVVFVLLAWLTVSVCSIKMIVTSVREKKWLRMSASTGFLLVAFSLFEVVRNLFEEKNQYAILVSVLFFVVIIGGAICIFYLQDENCEWIQLEVFRKIIAVLIFVLTFICFLGQIGELDLVSIVSIQAGIVIHFFQNISPILLACVISVSIILYNLFFGIKYPILLSVLGMLGVSLCAALMTIAGNNGNSVWNGSWMRIMYFCIMMFYLLLAYGGTKGTIAMGIIGHIIMALILLPQIRVLLTEKISEMPFDEQSASAFAAQVYIIVLILLSLSGYHMIKRGRDKKMYFCSIWRRQMTDIPGISEDGMFFGDMKIYGCYALAPTKTIADRRSDITSCIETEEGWFIYQSGEWNKCSKPYIILTSWDGVLLSKESDVWRKAQTTLRNTKGRYKWLDPKIWKNCLPEFDAKISSFESVTRMLEANSGLEVKPDLKMIRGDVVFGRKYSERVISNAYYRKENEYVVQCAIGWYRYGKKGWRRCFRPIGLREYVA